MIYLYVGKGREGKGLARGVFALGVVCTTCKYRGCYATERNVSEVGRLEVR